MDETKLDPRVALFKEYINKQPKLLVEIRESGRPLQEYYEEWLTRSADKSTLEQGGKMEEEANNNQANSLNDWMKLVERFNVNQLEEFIGQWGPSIETIREVLRLFVERPATEEQQVNKKHQTFVYRD